MVFASLDPDRSVVGSYLQFSSDLFYNKFLKFSGATREGSKGKELLRSSDFPLSSATRSLANTAGSVFALTHFVGFANPIHKEKGLFVVRYQLVPDR